MANESGLVRTANLDDVQRIIDLASPYVGKLIPYIHDIEQVAIHIDYFLVYELDGQVVGARHVVPSKDEFGTEFLLDTVQVPADFVGYFNSLRCSSAFMAHVICPYSGSQARILNYLKERYEYLFSWTSKASPAYRSLQRHGFDFIVTRRVWNQYKSDFSEFSLGRWIR